MNRFASGSKKVSETSSVFSDYYFINWSEWGLPSSYEKLSALMRHGEPARPLLCAIGSDCFAVRTQDRVFVTQDARVAIAVWVHECGPKLEGGMPTPTFVKHIAKD